MEIYFDWEQDPQETKMEKMKEELNKMEEKEK